MSASIFSNDIDTNAMINSSIQEGLLENSKTVLKYKKDPFRYTELRCILPTATETGFGPEGSKWFPRENLCPCDPNLSIPTGRGYTSCSFGIQTDVTEVPISDIMKPLKRVIGYSGPNGFNTISEDVSKEFIDNSGSLYQDKQYIAPQLDPRPLTLIGYTWRSS